MNTLALATSAGSLKSAYDALTPKIAAWKVEAGKLKTLLSGI